MTVQLRSLLPASSLPELPEMKLRYSSDIDDLVHDFFVPTLGCATRYDRAVGYFTAGALARLAPALELYLDRVLYGSSDSERRPIRVVASPNLPELDLRHMQLGYQRRTIEQECSVHRPEFADALSAVTWMIESELMEFWLVPGYADGTECLYHEKIGLIEDSDGNYVTFEGSPNETSSGLGLNIESFPIHRSWVHAEAPHARAAKEAIDDLFAAAGTRPLRVEPFPKALEEGLVRTYAPRRPQNARRKESKMQPSAGTAGQDSAARSIEIPSGVKFRSYQRNAISTWLKADGQGLFAMATGTGKTFTALGAAERLARVYDDPPGLTVLVLVPDNSLVDMWQAELQTWGAAPICSTAASATRRLRDALRRQRVRGGTTFAVWTDKSAINERFSATIRDFPSPRLLIADECHALGSEGNQQLLTDDYHYRLGLSATVDRHLDPDGTATLRDYFGEVLADIDIKQAIDMGALCRYTYHPVLVPLTREEMEEYARLSREIGKRARNSVGFGIRDLEDSAKMLLFERAGLLAHAEGKPPAFRGVVDSLPHEARSYSLVYTAEGESALTGLRQAPSIHGIAQDFGLKYRDFVGDTPLDERAALLKRLGAGEIDGLIAMKCLDQGIDVPTAQVAHFLASTKNPRQYIQRRGRILRQPKDGTPKKAAVYDYVAHPDGAISNFALERRLVAQEVLRAKEMASAAENPNQAMNDLRPLLDRYNLWDTFGGD